ncbi:cysteine-rich tail protein 1 [Protobothrops mucrosquamatus]|uniref:cysteine-rich tail protein 1 n=1 Tax=Protobothrops mucrosquamatus TaxID=103944 RepID=UPI000775C495|nr:cysteine-rich tail protein 1 [Protobothrops mucrosquamatus]
MDRGLTIENPYASVTIPRAQLKDDFLREDFLGEDFSPNVLPPCSAAPQKEADPKSPSLAWNGQRSQAQVESQARPTNPYASLKVPREEAPEPFRWKSHEEAAPDPGCCGCCGCCSPCCRKCCCVVS